MCFRKPPAVAAALAAAKTAAAAARAAAGRQTASDKKWEGSAWISPQELALAVNKRTRLRKGAVDDDDVITASGDAPVAVPPPHAPPRPADPPAHKDFASRKRDKDRIPSAQTWVWSPTKDAWDLVPRPRVLEMGPFFSYKPIPDKQVRLLAWLVSARRAQDGMPTLNTGFLTRHLLPRLNRVSNISLRLIDWLVVDYARDKRVAYRRFFPAENVFKVVVVYRQYALWSSWWRRRHYDVFRRRHRIYFQVDGETYSTTVAQLHFFYMAEQYGFLEYAERNRDAIEAHMQAALKASADAKAAAASKGEAYHRKPLVGRAPPVAYAMSGEFTVQFHDGDTSDEGSDDEVDQEEVETPLCGK
jgi:hypothetical protein